MVAGPSKGGHLGRSSVQVVAEKRRSELDALLSALLGLAEEVAHSDLVYTFLHPLLRDQDEAADVQVAKLRTTKSNADSASGRCHAVRGAFFFLLSPSMADRSTNVPSPRERSQWKTNRSPARARVPLANENDRGEIDS